MNDMPCRKLLLQSDKLPLLRGERGRSPEGVLLEVLRPPAHLLRVGLPCTRRPSAVGLLDEGVLAHSRRPLRPGGVLRHRARPASPPQLVEVLPECGVVHGGGRCVGWHRGSQVLLLLLVDERVRVRCGGCGCGGERCGVGRWLLCLLLEVLLYGLTLAAGDCVGPGVREGISPSFKFLKVHTNLKSP